MATRTGTDEELMREAFQALLRGDTKTRDEICEQVKRRMDAREAGQVEIAVEAAPYFTKQ